MSELVSKSRPFVFVVCWFKKDNNNSGDIIH